MFRFDLIDLIDVYHSWSTGDSPEFGTGSGGNPAVGVDPPLEFPQDVCVCS